MSYSSEVLADSPLGYWRLGESSGTSAVDSSSNGRTGTYQNAIALGTTGALAADSNTAATFNGSNARVDIPATGMDTGDFTVEAWFKTSTASKRQIVSRWSNGGGFSAQRWTLQLEGSGNPYFYCYDSGYRSVGIATAKADGAWHHLAVTAAGNTLTMYLDGAQVATSTKAGTLSGSTTAVRIGSTTDPAEFFNGGIDEVAIYGSALSSGRIAAHYAAGITGSITIVGTPAVATATMLDGAPRVGLRINGEAWTGAATTLDGTIPVSVPITVSGDAWTAAATALDGAGRFRVSGEPWAASADFPNGNIVGAPIVVAGEKWAAAASVLDGFAFTPPPRNGFGLVLDSSAVLTVDDVLEPEPTVPAGTPSTVLHIVAPTVPVPTLVAGRPL